MLETESNKEEREQMERRIGALSGGITTVYVDAPTATERYYLKKKAEDAINSCVGALNGGMLQGGGVAFKEVAEELGENSILYNSLVAPYNKIIGNNGGNELDLTNVYDSFIGMKSVLETSVSTIKILLTNEGIVAPVEHSMVESLKKAVNQQ